MWLPKDERKMLQEYFIKINDINTQHEFFYDDLLRIIKSKESSRNEPFIDEPYGIKRLVAWKKDCNRIIIANKALKKRGLIISSTEEFEPSQAITISLTLTGYDLGRKYNSWWSRSHLWFAEYKDHWFWLVLSFLGGIVGALVVNWLSN
jgi:hypothetical protein